MNGITPKGNHLIVAGMQLASIDLPSGIIQQIGLNKNIADFDGLASIDNVNIICSQVGNGGKIWAVNNSGDSELIYQCANYLADLIGSE